MSENTKSSLVILYHREPYDEVVENGKTVYREKKSPNGILPTLKSFFANAQQSTWVAWKQVDDSNRDSFQSRMTIDGLGDRCVVMRVPLEEQQVQDFYYITSKEACWPLLHSFPWQFEESSSNWDNFREVNKVFAQAAIDAAADDALIWIHDYNLWLAPYFIRQQRPNAKIVFFHHTPFPSSDVFNILPWREEIVESLLSCDVCGFHIPRYSEDFVGVARSMREVEVVKREPVTENFVPRGLALSEPDMVTQLRYKGRIVHLSASPVGTNPGFVRSVVADEETKAKVKKIRADLGDRKLIVAASRVDYVKGIIELLDCYERLLIRRPEMLGKVSLVVAVAPAASGMRIYSETQEAIEKTVGRINGRFNQLDWRPIDFYTSNLGIKGINAFYKAADIAWITPLRDGLNLVGKEYVAARGDDGGVLILSEFVGSSVELPDAVPVNPYSTESMDKALDIALAMPIEEQKERMARMTKSVDTYDVDWWAEHLMEPAKTTGDNA
ncbi:glucosylglycerol-phosphate synthase [filamentous cyanobacterium LEGE 11480]|uniref:Glucosylglycerol-phosphate synthase n=1 Tax=Romeriopsis navalis LEGE 11480 TaxID=2777977 RepID=A0A928VQ43_9CYAN|nr:glucosylglycerol-phosphate synthase [Romeriopsis navalis]MBE9030039.1 glucosylglycerol-phosphate synthase [Romeriopsis navalis LEGE 11480]